MVFISCLPSQGCQPHQDREFGLSLLYLQLAFTEFLPDARENAGFTLVPRVRRTRKEKEGLALQLLECCQKILEYVTSSV